MLLPLQISATQVNERVRSYLSQYERAANWQLRDFPALASSLRSKFKTLSVG